MFRSLVSASLKHRLFVLTAALVLVVYGSITLPSIPIDVFPDLNRPTVTLLTEAEGLAPQEVEQLITFPIETAMNGNICRCGTYSRIVAAVHKASSAMKGLRP